MVNESGSVTSPHVATPRDVSALPVAGLTRRPVLEQDLFPGPAGPKDRPGFVTLYAQLRAAKDLRGEAALQFRQGQASLRQADELLEEIKSQLLQIVKQYPPFSLESPQRIAYLNAITGLRKQLDALAFPPDRRDQEAGESGIDWQNSVPPRPGYPAPGELAITELDPRMATDDDVKTALDAITKAQEGVSDARAGMWQDVVRYVGEASIGQIADYKAESQAQEVRVHIAANPSRGIGLSADKILGTGT